eukprot:747933-Hanusia_phi.AAC.1
MLALLLHPSTPASAVSVSASVPALASRSPPRQVLSIPPSHPPSLLPFPSLSYSFSHPLFSLLLFNSIPSVCAQCLFKTFSDHVGSLRALIIAVEDNKTKMKAEPENLQIDCVRVGRHAGRKFGRFGTLTCTCNSYLEAIGMLAAHRAGEMEGKRVTRARRRRRGEDEEIEYECQRRDCEAGTRRK